MVWSIFGCHSCKNSRVQVIRNTHKGILLTNFFFGKIKNTIIIQNIS